MVVLVTAEALAIALLVVLVAGLLRSHAEILRRLHELGAGLDPDADEAPVARHATVPDPVVRRRAGGPGAGAHDLAGQTPSGEAVVVGVAGAGHRTLVAFLSSGCTTCRPLWSGVGPGSASTPSMSLPGSPRIVVVTRGADQESTSAVTSLSPDGATVVMSNEAWEEYKVPGAPYFVFVDGPTASVIGEGTARTWSQLVDLVGQAFDDDRHPGRGTFFTGPEREERIDAELAASGILPGDASLYDRDRGEIVTGGAAAHGAAAHGAAAHGVAAHGAGKAG